jgi:hypothetical protein
MDYLLLRAARGVLRRFGLNVVLYVDPRTAPPPADIDADAAATAVPGAIVECGVWRGGSMLAAARTLNECSDVTRHLYLYDTFEGMSAPDDRDVDIDGHSARALLGGGENDNPDSAWCYATLEEVRETLAGSGYDMTRVHFVKGKVEDTIPESAPDRIAVLRLDTDWYESTRHELEHLYPRLSPGGVLIIDDYGHWAGCRQAVDEYFAAQGIHLLLSRVDYTGRIAVKPA